MFCVHSWQVAADDVDISDGGWAGAVGVLMDSRQEGGGGRAEWGKGTQESQRTVQVGRGHKHPTWQKKCG